MKASKKTAFIKIDYYDRNELVKCIDNFKFQVIAKSISSGKKIINESRLEFMVRYDQENEFREEEVNGVLCRIYQSKMNSN